MFRAGRKRRRGRILTIHALAAHAITDEGHDLRSIARMMQGRAALIRSRAVDVRYVVAPAPTGSSTMGMARLRACSAAANMDRIQAELRVPILITRAAEDSDHLRHLLLGMGHDRRGAQGQQSVGGNCSSPRSW